MANLEPDGPDAPACPFIGLADDPRTRFTFPHPDHRCRAEGRPGAVVHAHQARICLTRDYASCDRYRALMALGSTLVHPSPATPASQPVIHVFREGDSLARIAALYGVSVDQVVAANDLPTSGSVVDGQRLRILLAEPSGSASTDVTPRLGRSV